MPRADQANVRNAPGLWYVDTRCVRCDAARHWGPGLIETDDAGRSFVARQPVGEEFVQTDLLLGLLEGSLD